MRDLLQQRSFARMVGTQFLTVFNDNAFRQTVLLIAIGAEGLGHDPQARAGLVFALPFLLFGVFAGDLADRISKRSAILAAKWAEVLVMALAAFALFIGDLRLGIGALFLMGLQSAFLSPAKYGIIPELIPRRSLARANGLMHSSVLLGIILGQALAGALVSTWRERLWLIGALLASIAAVGVVIARGIEPVPAADPQRRMQLNPLARLPAGLRLASARPPLLAVMMAHGVFHLVGATFLYSWNEMGTRDLELDPGPWSAALASLSLALAMGSLLAGRLCRHRLRAGLVPLGGAVLGLSLMAVAAGPRDPGYVYVVLLVGYVSAGLFLVPLNTLLQELPSEHEKGLALGASITMDWVFIVAASLLKESLTRLGIGPQQSFYVLGVIMLLTALLLARLGPVTMRALETCPRHAPSAGDGA